MPTEDPFHCTGCSRDRSRFCLLDFRKPSQSFLPKAKIFDLSKTVAAGAMLCDSLWTNGKDETIRTTVDLDLADGCLIRGDETELFEVFVNLIKNSAEALPHGGTIRIKTYVQEDHVIMEVTDNGVGIPPEHLPKVFEPFWTTNGRVGWTNANGRGMGLAACHGIVSRHEGEITVQSELGKGTSFVVKLPLEREHGGRGTSKALEAGDLSLRILLVDDERDVVLLLKESLSMCGQTVFTAFSGRESLDFLRKTEVDVVICDLAMPEMNGWEVGREVRALCAAKGIRRPLFLLLTGWGNAVAPEERGDKWGVDSIVRKPMDAPSLLAKIGDLTKRPSTTPHC